MDSLLDLYHMQRYVKNPALARVRFAFGYLFSNLLKITSWRLRLLYQMHDLASKALSSRVPLLSLFVTGFESREY